MTASRIGTSCALILAAACGAALATLTHAREPRPMRLGNFSVSLAVKDIHASKAFYEKLDFVEVGGNVADHWVVLKNGQTKIGLFQGMFEKNLLTFNPGWNSDKQTLDDFEDVRELQKVLKERGITVEPAADESTRGPAFFSITDPDGNALLFDQHVDSPKRLGAASAK